MYERRAVIAPAAWASALVNGDQSGLTVEDIVAVNDWIRYELVLGEHVVGIEGKPFYSSHTIIGPNKWFSGEVVEYRTLKIAAS